MLKNSCDVFGVERVDEKGSLVVGKTRFNGSLDQMSLFSNNIFRPVKERLTKRRRRRTGIDPFRNLYILNVDFRFIENLATRSSGSTSRPISRSS